MFQRFSVFIGLAIVIILLASCKKEVPVPVVLPDAEFGYTGGNCIGPCEVEFTNASSNADEYLWDFGDGGLSTEKNPKHKFNSSGTFNVGLKAKNSKNGLSDTQIKEISISAVPSKMTITKVVLKKWPLKDSNGNYFDGPTDPPDLYLFMLVGGAGFYDGYYKNSIITNPVEGQPYEIVVDKALTANSLLEVKLYDFDTVSPNSVFMSAFNLIPIDFAKGKVAPATIDLSNSTTQIILYVTWQL